MDFESVSIGTDIEEIDRFEGKTLETDASFLSKIFTENELKYCFSRSNSAGHLCARYCTKEAVVKALYGLGIKDVYYKDVEVLNNSDGVPLCAISKYPNIKVKITLSHSKNYAIANAMVIN